jgi:sugar/nucleoside kinase (ribokinase family)
MNLLYSQTLVSDGIVNEFPAIRLPSERVVDTNGAGDAFVGGEFIMKEKFT